VQIQKWVPQCKMAWPDEGQAARKTSGGWGPHRWVSVLGKCMEDNLQMGKLMVGEMDG
jgi:hypothetical protein